MKNKIEVTTAFKLALSKDEVIKALVEMGYEIPEDAHLFSHIGHDTETILYISWSKAEDERD